MKSRLTLVAGIAFLLGACTTGSYVTSSYSDDIYFNPGDVPPPIVVDEVAETPTAPSAKSGERMIISQMERNDDGSSTMNNYIFDDSDENADVISYDMDQMDLTDSDTSVYYNDDEVKYVINNYYDGDDLDFAYRIRRFHNPYFYDPFFWDNWYYDPFYYSSWYYPSWSLSWGWGYPYYSWYSPYYSWGWGYPYYSWYSPYYAWGYPSYYYGGGNYINNSANARYGRRTTTGSGVDRSISRTGTAISANGRRYTDSGMQKSGTIARRTTESGDRNTDTNSSGVLTERRRTGSDASVKAQNGNTTVTGTSQNARTQTYTRPVNNGNSSRTMSYTRPSNNYTQPRVVSQSSRSTGNSTYSTPRTTSTYNKSYRSSSTYNKSASQSSSRTYSTPSSRSSNSSSYSNSGSSNSYRSSGSSGGSRSSGSSMSSGGSSVRSSGSSGSGGGSSRSSSGGGRR